MDQTKAEPSGEFSGPYLDPQPGSTGPEAQKTGTLSQQSPNIGHVQAGFVGRGIQVVRIADANIKSSSSVVASISEIVLLPFMMGNAPMSVLNVQPYDRGVLVRVNVDFDRPLWFKVMVIYANASQAS